MSGTGSPGLGVSEALSKLVQAPNTFRRWAMWLLLDLEAGLIKTSRRQTFKEGEKENRNIMKRGRNQEAKNNLETPSKRWRQVVSHAEILS